MIKKFVWEKWVDPIDAFKEDFLGEENLDFSNKLRGLPIMHTPFGSLPMTEYSGACDKFDLWLLHTNFDITKKIVTMIAKTKGVDSVDPVTRYRVRIGFPRIYKGESPIFNIKMVKEEIQKNILAFFHFEQNKLLSSSFDLDVVRKAREVRDHLDKNNEYWALYVLPNGQMDVVKSPQMNENYIDKVGELVAVNHMVGGLLLQSENS